MGLANHSIDDNNKKRLMWAMGKEEIDEEDYEEDEDGEYEQDELVDPSDIIVIDDEGNNQHRDVIERIGKLNKLNPENSISQTGALIDSIVKVQNESEKCPRKRGNMTCFVYNEVFNKIRGEPLFVLGPTWRKSMLYVLGVNILVGVGIDTLDHRTWVYHLLYIGMIVWNLVTIYLIVLNPGLAPRDPSIHQKIYLQEISNRNMITCLCTTCNIIER